jgi:hypothetical protein
VLYGCSYLLGLADLVPYAEISKRFVDIDLRPSKQPAAVKRLLVQYISPEEYKNFRRQVREDELLLQLERALYQLVETHQPVTQTAIASIVGMSLLKLKWYPRIKIWFEQRASVQQNNKRERMLTEQAFLQGIEAAIQHLKACGQRLTLRAVGEYIGCNPDNLKRYPATKTLLEQHINRPYKRGNQKEQVLLTQVEQAIKRLESLEQPVTQAGVSRLIGVSTCKLRWYPSVQALFDQRANQYYQYQMKQVYQREEALLADVEKTIKELASKGQLVTHDLVGEILGKKPQTLYRYPRVKALLQQTSSTRQTQKILAEAMNVGQNKKPAKLSIEDLWGKVRAAAELLMAEQQPVTILAICAIIGLHRKHLYKYPQIIARVKELARESNQQINQRHFQQREEALLHRVLAAKEYLELHGIRVSVQGIKKITGIDPGKFTYYPKIRLALDDIIKKKPRPKYPL